MKVYTTNTCTYLSKVILLLLFSTVIQQVVCETITIVPSSESICSKEICYTLNQYASNTSLNSDLDNITLELQPGIHTLDVPLTVSDISSFTLRGENATLQCVQKFNFNATEYVSLHGISFKNCGGRSSVFENHADNIGKFVFEDSSFQSDEPFYIRSTTNIQFINSTFTHSPRGVLSIYSPKEHYILIRNCIFLNTSSSFSMKSGLISVHGLTSTVTIQNSLFKNNHMSGNFTSGVFQGRGQKLAIINSTFLENSGGRRASGAINSSYQSVTISGCTFSDNIGDRAGAVSLNRDNSVVIINESEFFNNTGVVGGGAVDIVGDESTITIEKSTFDYNKASYFYGGALAFDIDNSTVSLNDCSFTENSVADGGAMGISGFNVSLIVSRSRFLMNNATLHGGAIILSGDFPMILIDESTFDSNSASYGTGGAISVRYSEQRSDAVFVVSNSVFDSNNVSLDDCGALDITASTSPQEYLVHLQVSTSIFRSNSQGRGYFSGVVCLSHINASIDNTNFSGNMDRALTARESTVRVSGCIFNSNSGGAVYGQSNFIGVFNQTVFTNNSAGRGGAMYLSDSQVLIYDSTYEYNRANSGGAMYLSDSQVLIHDSTFGYNEARNRGGAIAIYGGALDIEDSNVYNNTARVGSVISACRDVNVSVNISDHLFVSMDHLHVFIGIIQTPRKLNCVLYSTDLEISSTEYSTTEFYTTEMMSGSNAMSIITKASPLSFTIFVISSVIIILL